MWTRVSGGFSYLSAHVWLVAALLFVVLLAAPRHACPPPLPHSHAATLRGNTKHKTSVVVDPENLDF
jgi:hypothetical protein